MPAHLLVAGLDARSLLLEAPLLQRERHVVDERATVARADGRHPAPGHAPRGARPAPAGPDLPEAIRRIRSGPGHARRLDPGAAARRGAGGGRGGGARGRRQRRAAPAARPRAPRDVAREAPDRAAPRGGAHARAGPRGGHAPLDRGRPLLRPDAQPQRQRHAAGEPGAAARDARPRARVQHPGRDRAAAGAGPGRARGGRGATGRTSATASSSCSCRPTARRRSPCWWAAACRCRPRRPPTWPRHPLARSGAQDWVYEILEPVRQRERLAGGDPPRAARAAGGPASAGRSTWSRDARARACSGRRAISWRAIRTRRSDRRTSRASRSCCRCATRGRRSPACLQSLAGADARARTR